MIEKGCLCDASVFYAMSREMYLIVVCRVNCSVVDECLFD